jgi:hypothetical protein
MPALRKALILGLAAAAVSPAAAQANPTPQPLLDVAPLGTHFKDRVLSSAKTMAHAAATAQFRAYPTKEGTSVQVAISDTYAGSIDSSVAQSYVDFLDGLDHGPELPLLKIIIAPPAEVLAACGGQEGTLACYDSGTSIMEVPGEQTASTASSSGVTTSYVVAHEYGHHIAANRSNAPFNAFQFGPKFWASYEMVCDRTSKSLLAPGNEDRYYAENPGEGWAETYAQLKYPDVDWQFTPLLKPDAGAFAAARQDVLNPWQYAKTNTFKGSFGRSGSNSKRVSFVLNLDGALSVKLQGPRKSNYNLVITSNGKKQGSTTTAGSRDKLSYQAACRTSAAEHVTVTVKRVTGSGPFTLRTQYAG